jgi:hypothetical protein
MFDFKLQWDDYKSVDRSRLVKAENSSAYVMVNCEVWIPAITSLVSSDVYKMSIYSNHPIQNSTISHVQTQYS